MKLNVWIVSTLAPLTMITVLAQDPAPAPARTASSVKKKVVLDPPAPAAVKSSNVNLRGQPSFRGETLGHLQKGDSVTVLEQITLSHPKKDEPADWSQIALPSAIPVWVSGNLIDSETKTIKARRVNLRGGPGENFSVVGRLEKGAAIKEIKTEGGWVAIEAPTNAHGYVASEFLEIQAPPVVVATAPTPAPEPQVVNVPTPAPAAAAATEPVPTPVAPAPLPQQSEVERELAALHNAESTPAAVAQPAPIPAPEPAPTTAPAAAPTGPLPPRIVTREGFVRNVYNIQGPTDYELHDIQSGKLIEYLAPKPGLNFKIFVGTRVTVTGPEGMDPRWTRTPVLQVQSVDLMP